MTPEIFEQLQGWFDGYAGSYLTENQDHNQAIRLKREHTGRVVENIRMLAGALGLNDADRRLAETMALFHDIGRFEQYAVYGTFSDGASENHALLGLRQMARHNLLAGCARAEKRLIARAIAFHNAAELPADEPQRPLFFMKLLRDADKLDIWKVVNDYYQRADTGRNTTHELGLPDDPACSTAVLAALNRREIVRMQTVRTLNDLKLLQISWVFDLNFTASFKLLRRRHYLRMIEAVLPRTPEIGAAVENARRHMDTAVNGPDADAKGYRS